MKMPTSLDAIDTSWTWTTCEDAQWRNGQLGFNTLDTTSEEAWEYSPGRFYRPLREHTALFIEFSQTPTSKAGILKFVKAYGLLGANDSTKQNWKQSITEMRDAVAAWRTIEGGASAENLRLVMIRLLPPRFPFKRARAREAMTKSRSELLEDCKRQLQIFVNRRLATHATPAQLVLTRNADFQLTFRPEHLLGAMWLQFAQAMARNYNIKICRGCGRPFQTGAGTNRRADATTCKDSCRQKAYLKQRRGKQQ